MSTLTTLHAGEGLVLAGALERMEQIGVGVRRTEATALYERLQGFGSYIDSSETPPGVKGFDMALRTLHILTGVAEPQTVPESRFSADGSEYIVEVPRPFNMFILGNESDKDKELNAAQRRGYRLGLYVIGRLSPLIDYESSSVGAGEEKLLARHKDSTRVLVGRHILAEHIGDRNIGYAPGVFPANARRVYSYTVETQSSPASAA